ncbi:hypothetical protein OUZ56_005259 [Daphnia magna]|uniref:Uncharacterized protein n=1 Tax=Daphnia magna TaxID=35525 RepID=A0ABQ9YSA2_9CRUS|nr:hypothetical protein OUZ56_005259 [Daphnia magna]
MAVRKLLKCKQVVVDKNQLKIQFWKHVLNIPRLIRRIERDESIKAGHSGIPRLSDMVLASLFFCLYCLALELSGCSGTNAVTKEKPADVDSWDEIKDGFVFFQHNQPKKSKCGEDDGTARLLELGWPVSATSSFVKICLQTWDGN